MNPAFALGWFFVAILGAYLLHVFKKFREFIVYIHNSIYMRMVLLIYSYLRSTSSFCILCID